MAEKEYIERERIEKFFDGIYDCADLTFEPNDHCCAADDCAHCKWYEAKNAIQKRILSIPAADVRPVVKAHWIHVPSDGKFRDTCICSACKKSPPIESWVVQGFNACPYCFADMREKS